jgi:SNF2 family DNA or RNA helicase
MVEQQVSEDFAPEESPARSASEESPALALRAGEPPQPDASPDVIDIDVTLPLEVKAHPRFEKPLHVAVKEGRLLKDAPWVRSLGKLPMEVATEGWRFPPPILEGAAPSKPRLFLGEPAPANAPLQVTSGVRQTRPRPPSDTVLFKDRLLYLLQPSLESLFAGRQVQLPFPPFPYQLDGIAFLMPRHAALLADDMGLGKTMQTIVSLRLMFHAGLIHRALLVCPKPLVPNWGRELRTWAEDIPFEVINGSTHARRFTWLQSKAPLKLVNYEVLTRDAELLADDKVRFDVMVLDEAQRIKNREAKTAQVVRAVRRSRSWALTGTPIENTPEDLINIFAFVDPDRIPPETPSRQLPQLVGDSILRRTTEEVLTDMPPKIIRDAFLEMTPAQRETYTLAEKEGVVRLNALGDTISVQHVFELVMRLKQICNFDPVTKASAKLEQLAADLAEVASCGKKAIVFSQWVEPLEQLAQCLADLGPLQYHGKVAHKEREAILGQFRTDPGKHVLLMSYGTGSVGLNLQFTNYVFLFDRWWNPAIEDQAIKRAHRIGQKETVFVTRFITQGTIENRIHEVLDRKRQLFNDLLSQNGPPAQLGLTQDEIFGLFDIKARPLHRAA